MSRFSLLLITLFFVCFQQFVWCAKSSKKELPKYPKLSDKVKKAEKIDGFFTLYRQDNHVHGSTQGNAQERVFHVHQFE